jgi:hypothetical protein
VPILDLRLPDGRGLVVLQKVKHGENVLLGFVLT